MPIAGFAARLLIIALVVSAVATLRPSVQVASAQGAPGIDAANFDPTCKPCDDFFAFATGGWMKTHSIPAGHPSWGSFNELQAHNQEALHTILEAAAVQTSAAAGSDDQKIRSFYRACMDEAAIERAGTAPLDPFLHDIAAVENAAAVAREAAKLQVIGVGDGPNFTSLPDAKDSSKTIAALATGGLGMPDRDYYVKGDDKTLAIRAAYREYVSTQLQNLGESASTADAAADAIVTLETKLAQATPERADLFDPTKTYHPTSVTSLATVAPGVPWPAFFAPFGAPAFDSLNVVSPALLAAYGEAFTETPVATWREYLWFHLVDAYAATLPKRFADAAFGFHSGVMLGVQEQLPRWQRCVAATDRALRTPLGKAYVAANFTPAAKARAVQMVDNLQMTLRTDIWSLSWMSASTKQAAVAKLEAFTKKVGYPDNWQDYSTLQIAEGQPYAALAVAVRAWNTGVVLARIGKPTDRTRWGLTTPTVNAYYNPPNNEIVFPAGILQPPFYNPQADDAVNYGAIGAVIGHEMTHGFDNNGRQFDRSGDLRDWWTSQDAANFKSRAQCIIDEYDAFAPVPGVKENGRLVQGEAIADLGGTTIAYKAFERTAEFRSDRKIDGYTPQQRFFLAYAQVWRSLETEAFARQLAAINEHADPKLRVNGTVSNMPTFAQAFMCPLHAAMVRTPRCEIW